MSNSTAPPDSSITPPPLPGGDKSPPPPPPSPADNSSPPPADNSSPPPPDNSSPPPAPPLSPPPTSSSPPPTSSSPPPTASSPPPTDDPPSPPPPSSKSPPPPKSSSSPPPTSNPSPPPPHSSKSPPPPPSDSSTPPPSSDSPPSPPPTDSSTPPPPSDSSTPPPTEKTPPPPSHGKSPPPPPPSEFAPPPTDQFSPPPPLPENAAPPPPPHHHLSPPPATPPTQHSPIAPPTSQTSLPNGTTPSPSTSTTPHSPPSHGPTTSALAPPAAPPPDSKGAAIGGAVAGIVIIAFLAIFFIARRRKKRSAVYATQYMPPNSFSSKSDGFYMHNSGPQSGFYSQPQQSFHGNTMGHSYGGSQRGNSYYQSPPTETNALGSAQSLFTYEELMEITNGFSQQNVIGEGGFGCVYKGSLRDGRVVAIKQLKKGSGQGEREFRAEVEIISRVHHRYLVSLVGYCICDTQRLLIYEYVPNQTLEHHLHGKDMPVLEWTKRLRIALGAARGLAYLHDDCHPKIIHRDIKSANILLDDAYEAQVADFGLAKLTDDTNTHVSTRVMGTFGYMAPEYASSGKLTDRSDVFSFGVVLLELITGRKPVDQTQPLGDESLVEWARPLLGRALDTGDFTEIVDSRLEKHYVEAEMFRMVEAAAACVRHSAPKRPRMKQVARALDCEEEASDLSNGVKYGQSTIYESGQYNQDISRFRKMAFGSGGSKEFDMYSGDYTTSIEITDTSSEIPSGESETQAMNARNRDGGRRFR